MKSSSTTIDNTSGDTRIQYWHRREGELVGMVTIAANAGDTISIENTFGNIALNAAQIIITKLD